MSKSRFSNKQQGQTQANSPSSVMVRHVMPSQINQSGVVSDLQVLLDENERQRMSRFMQPKQRHAYLVSHGLKRLLLAERLGCEPSELTFKATDKGKPFVDYPTGIDPQKTWHFNLSHTEDQVAVALSQQPVGIDVENTSRRLPDLDLAKRYFSSEEYDRLVACEPAQRGLLFLKHWTLKEAYLKAEGWGLSTRMDAFMFNFTDPTDRITLEVLDPAGAPSRPWHFWQKTLAPRFLLSLAFATQEPLTDALIDCQPWQP